MELLKNHLEQAFFLGRFEIRTKTKKHNSPYVTFELANPLTPEEIEAGIKELSYSLFSGYGTALGSKLLKIVELCSKQDKDNAKIEGNHAYVNVAVELPVFFKLNKSQAGEYLDIYAQEENF